MWTGANAFVLSNEEPAPVADGRQESHVRRPSLEFVEQMNHIVFKCPEGSHDAVTDVLVKE